MYQAIFIGAVWLSLAAVSVSPLEAQFRRLFPWLQRADPKIQTEVIVDKRTAELLELKIGIFPFASNIKGEPGPPPFAQYLEKALLQAGADAAAAPRRPWDGLPRHRVRSLTVENRRAALAAAGRSSGRELVIWGTVENFYRDARGGLRVRVSLRVISAESGTVLWRGEKHAEWIRSFPAADCLLNLAWSFVAEWLPPEEENSAEPAGLTFWEEP